MNKKQEILTTLRNEFKRWEDLQAGLSQEQMALRHSPSELSIMDVIAHLMAWQQISIARLEAARLDKEPVLPDWLEGSDPESEDETDRFNAKIFEIYHQQPVTRVHQEWKDGFLRFLELAEAISDNDLSDTEKYLWLKGYSLFDVLQGSLEHHEEHREQLLEK